MRIQLDTEWKEITFNSGMIFNPNLSAVNICFGTEMPITKNAGFKINVGEKISLTKEEGIKCYVRALRDNSELEVIEGLL